MAKALATVLSALITLSPLTAAAADLVPAPGGAEELVPDDRSWVSVAAEKREERSVLVDCGLSIEKVGSDHVEGIADPSVLACVKKAGFKVLSAKALASFDPKDFPPQDSAYHNLQEMDEEFKKIVDGMGGGASVGAIGKTVQGREIKVLRMGGGSGKPGVLLMGTHHAREHISTEVPLQIGSWLAANAKDPGVAGMLKNRDIYILPVVNPDGVEYDIADGRYRWQRKNMRKNPDGSTGVDLNRNYGYAWGQGGASTSPGSETYRGPEAFSEPETKAVRDFLKSHPNITVVVTYHAYGDSVQYPWSYSYDPIPEPKAMAAFKAIGGKMGELTGYESIQSSDMYISSGDTCDWVWGELKMFCMTVELSGGSFYPGASIIGPTVEKNLKAALYLFDIADDPYRAGRSDAMVEKVDLDEKTEGALAKGEDARSLKEKLDRVAKTSAEPAALYDGR